MHWYSEVGGYLSTFPLRRQGGPPDNAIAMLVLVCMGMVIGFLSDWEYADMERVKELVQEITERAWKGGNGSSFWGKCQQEMLKSCLHCTVRTVQYSNVGKGAVRCGAVRCYNNV